MYGTPGLSDRGNREVSPSIGKSDLVLNDQFIERLLKELEKARHSVIICSYAWRWYSLEPELQIQKFNTLLLEKLRQGLHIKILCDSLVEFEKLKELGFNVAVVSKDKVLHIKAVCFDNKLLAIGSHNLTKSATSDNYEMTIFTDEGEPVIQFIDYFYKLWGVYA